MFKFNSYVFTHCTFLTSFFQGMNFIMASKAITEGMIVRYAREWCSPGERKYLHVVKENRLNPVTNKMTRWLIQTINMENMTLHPTSVVDDYMIEPTGFTINDYIPNQK